MTTLQTMNATNTKKLRTRKPMLTIDRPFRRPLLVAASLFTLGACDVLPLDPTAAEPAHVHDHGDELPETPDTRLHARLYLSDPLTDGELSEVVLTEPVSDDGTLTGQFVNALNCVNKDGGQALFGFASLCVEEKSVLPDEDGSYLSVEPPANDADQEDSFAELTMYHHVNRIHDYFRRVHGFEGLDFALDAVVNVSFKAQGQWQSFPNAAFMPEESFGALGLPARDFGAIMFGQSETKDFSYDASVILHEYTHAVVGTGRLQGSFSDAQGLNNTPGAINEAVADYFAASVLDAALIGPYALGDQGRDLSQARSCPADLTTEIHADGKIVGSSLWRLRQAFGAEVVDAAVFGAIQASSLATGFEEFGTLVLAEVMRISPDNAAQAEGILSEQGMLGCQRVKAWETVDVVATQEVPYTVDGRQSVMGSWPDGVPAYLQLEVAASSAPYVELEWELAAGGGGFFGGQTVPLSLALRVGEPVGLTGSAIVADAITTPAFANGTVQRVVVDASCAASGFGGFSTMFVNTGDSAASVVRLSLRDLDEVPADTEVVTCP